MPKSAPAKRAPKSSKPTSLRSELSLETSAKTPKSRRLKLPAHKLLRLKRIRYPEQLPSAWQLTKKTSELLWSRRRLFLGIVLIYGLLSLLLVRGFGGGTDVNLLKRQFDLGVSGFAGQLITGLSVYTTMLATSGGGSSATAGVYQIILGLIISLAVIWAIRQVLAGHTVRLRDAFYKGMYPLIPFVLVLLVVLLQTVPFLVGGGLYVIVVINGIAALALEKWLWALLFVALACVSAYMLCSSIFALYIVTLPDMTPIKALRSARQLVRYRRAQVFRKLIFLPFALLLITALIMVPAIWLIAPLAQWVFFALSIVGLVAVHAYLYTLYKELLT